MRKGEEVDINIEQLFVGDLVKIKPGMSIPVDGILIKGSGVACDEAAMTGESDEMTKDILKNCLMKHQEHLEEEAQFQKMERTAHSIPSPILLSGTQITTGEGWYLVIVVGEDSCQGKIMKKLEEKDDEQTPLQKKLESIANDIGILGTVAAGLTVAVLFI